MGFQVCSIQLPLDTIIALAQFIMGLAPTQAQLFQWAVNSSKFSQDVFPLQNELMGVSANS